MLGFKKFLKDIYNISDSSILPFEDKNPEENKESNVLQLGGYLKELNREGREILIPTIVEHFAKTHSCTYDESKVTWGNFQLTRDDELYTLTFTPCEDWNSFILSIKRETTLAKAA